MNIRTATRLEPVDSINIIDSFRHDNNQKFTKDQSGNSKENQPKDRQLQNQIYMESSVLVDVGQNINMFV